MADSRGQKMTDADRAIAARLETLRTNAGYRTMKAFAKAAGISYAAYYSYERSISRIPITSLWKVADLLGVSIDEVVGRDAPVVGGPYGGMTRSSRARLDEYAQLLTIRDAMIRDGAVM